MNRPPGVVGVKAGKDILRNDPTRQATDYPPFILGVKPLKNIRPLRREQAEAE
jgi:hypothetical protein